jgi:hypothetical protein
MMTMEQVCRDMCEQVGLDPKALREDHVEVTDTPRGYHVVIRHPDSADPLVIDITLPLNS